ncbi:flagellin [Loktanella salsilacus]|jgi:flagellin|uniref:Flagellin n=1 Tax=Loktanella salsilacus TaxID=195913 RepID=A0A1I4GKE4_9RHOB|nr:flagellin [Loktanella salsilacus]UTH50213.1 flagellar protein [Loktanella salsilacus]SFL29960.1 flagellin [Loktanella salsilacus]
MSSILTNNSAMNALTTLRNVNSNLNDTQTRISTGMKVNSAKDNASYFSISETMKSESGMNKAVGEGLTLSKNSVATARLGAETLVDLAQQFVDRVAFAQTEGVNKADIQKELESLSAQMSNAVKQSSFNGQNLISDAGNGSTATSARTVVSGVSRNGATLETTNINFTTTNLETVVTGPGAAASDDSFANIDVSDATTTMAAKLTAANAFLTAATGAATDLGIAEKQIETQQDFLSNLTDRLDSGVGSMVDADMEEEAARLQSLQVQQQLSTQSLSIANQAPQNILSLFR